MNKITRVKNQEKINLLEEEFIKAENALKNAYNSVVIEIAKALAIKVLSLIPILAILIQIAYSCFNMLLNEDGSISLVNMYVFVICTLGIIGSLAILYYRYILKNRHIYFIKKDYEKRVNHIYDVYDKRIAMIEENNSDYKWVTTINEDKK